MVNLNKTLPTGQNTADEITAASAASASTTPEVQTRSQEQIANDASATRSSSDNKRAVLEQAIKSPETRAAEAAEQKKINQSAEGLVIQSLLKKPSGTEARSKWQNAVATINSQKTDVFGPGRSSANSEGVEQAHIQAPKNTLADIGALIVSRQKANTANVSRQSRLQSKEKLINKAWPVQHAQVVVKADSPEVFHFENNKGIAAIAATFRKNPEFETKLQALSLDGETTLSYTMTKDMTYCYRALDTYSTYKTIPLREHAGSNKLVYEAVGDDEDEPDAEEGETKGVSLMIHTLLRLKEEGETSLLARDKPMHRLTATENEVTPYEYLAGQAPVFLSNNKPLQDLFNAEMKRTVMTGKGKTEPAYREMRAGIAIEMALDKAREVQSAWIALGMSVTLSAVLGVFLEIMAGNASIRNIFKKQLAEKGIVENEVQKLFTEVSEGIISEGDFKQRFSSVIVHAWPMMPTELLDTLIVLSALEALASSGEEGRKTLGTLFRDAVGRLPDAFVGGASAFAFSIPDKAMELWTAEGGMKVLRGVTKTGTSAVSVLACAAGLYPELGEKRYLMQAVIMAAYVGPNAHLKFPSHVDLRDPKSIRKFIDAEADKALNEDPSIGTGRSSVIGALMISLFATGMSFVLPGMIMNVLNLILFNPVETWTLNIMSLVKNGSKNYRLHEAIEKAVTKIVGQVQSGALSKPAAAELIKNMLENEEGLNKNAVDYFPENPDLWSKTIVSMLKPMCSDNASLVRLSLDIQAEAAKVKQDPSKREEIIAVVNQQIEDVIAVNIGAQVNTQRQETDISIRNLLNADQEKIFSQPHALWSDQLMAQIKKLTKDTELHALLKEAIDAEIAVLDLDPSVKSEAQKSIKDIIEKHAIRTGDSIAQYSSQAEKNKLTGTKDFFSWLAEKYTGASTTGGAMLVDGIYTSASEIKNAGRVSFKGINSGVALAAQHSIGLTGFDINKMTPGALTSAGYSATIGKIAPSGFNRAIEAFGSKISDLLTPEELDMRLQKRDITALYASYYKQRHALEFDAPNTTASLKAAIQENNPEFMATLVELRNMRAKQIETLSPRQHLLPADMRVEELEGDEE